MANVKITDLTAYTDAASTDVLPVVDVTNDVTKKISIANLLKAAPLGSAAAPGIAFDGDPNTGVYSPGADQVAISTNGAGRLFVDASGTALLKGTERLAFNTYVSDSNHAGYIGRNTSTGALVIEAQNAGGGYPMTFRTNSQERLRITDAGLVGIGVSSVTDQLELASGNYRGVTIKCGTTAHRPTLSFFNTADSLAAYIQASGNSLIFGSMGTDWGGHSPRMTLTGTGLGIGTTTVNSLLEVRGTSDSQNIIHLSNSAGASDGAVSNVIRVTCNGNTNWANLITSASQHFYNVNGVEAMRLDSSRRLLVGTSSAAGRSDLLQIQGESGLATGIGSISLRRGFAPGDLGSGSPLGRIDFGPNDGGTGARIEAVGDAAMGTNDYPSRLVFSTTADGASSPTERMRITNSGQILIGTTSTSTDQRFLVEQANTGWMARIRNTQASGGAQGLEISYSAQSPNGVDSPFLFCSDSSAVRMSVRSNGGIANFSGNNVNLSDRNAKKDISPAAGTWDCIKEWEIVNYRYKDQPDDADLNLGVIAQQVAESCPEVITVFQEATEDAPEKLGVREQQMYWMAIKALQEAQLRIETLEAKVAALEGA